MLNNLHWLGHASFRFDGSKVIYFDPWKISQTSKTADFIFITHEHFDHFCVDDIKLLSSKETVIITSAEVSKKLKAAKVLCKEVKSLADEDVIEISGVKIKGVPSYNINKQFHTKDSGKLGFIVELDGVKIYHAGDTDFIPEMENCACDIALLPVSGTYVMTAEEAAQAALAIKPKIAIPMHYGDIIGTENDARRFQELLKGKIEARILKKEN